MAKGIMVVQSGPVPGKEAEYNDWYDNTHIPEICAVPGFTGARRFKVAGKPGEAPAYLAIYEIEADEVTAPVQEMRARAKAGKQTPSDAITLDPPPVVTLYEQLD